MLAQSNNRVAIEKSWKTTEKRTVNDDQREVEIGHKQIMGLSGGAKQAETLQTFKDSVSISKDSGGYQSLNTTEVDVDDYHVFDTYVVKDSAYHLYSIDSNKEIVKIPRTTARPATPTDATCRACIGSARISTCSIPPKAITATSC